MRLNASEESPKTRIRKERNQTELRRKIDSSKAPYTHIYIFQMWNKNL